MVINDQPPNGEAQTDSWRHWWLPCGVAFLLILAAELIPPLRGLRAYAAPLVLLYLPFFFNRRLSLTDVGLTWPKIEGIWMAILSSGVIFVLFFAITRYALWGPWPGPPQPVWERLLAELLFAALPEEVFFRGWLQPRAEALTKKKSFELLGLKCTKGNLVTSAAFALMHLSTGRIDRLNVFFPGLWFGWLSGVSRSIWPAILVHAISNVWMAAASGY